MFVEANVKKWGLAPVQGTLAPPPAYGFEAGSFLLERGGETSSLAARSIPTGFITSSSSRYCTGDDEHDDNTPLIHHVQRNSNYAAIPIPSQAQGVPTQSPPSYSTLPAPILLMDQAEYERNRRAGLI